MTMTPLLSSSSTLHKSGTEETTSALNNATNTTNDSSVHPAPLFLPCNNPRNVVSPFVADVIDLVVFGGVLPVLTISGVITNVINMVVFARQGLSDRIHLCLFSLAVSDTGFLLFLMAGNAYPLVGLVDPVAGSYWLEAHNGPVLANYLAFLVISNITTALIAVERCLCILSPLKAAMFFKAKYMGMVIVVAAVFSLTVMNTALGLKFIILEVTDPHTNTTTFISRLSPTYLRHRTLIDFLYINVLLVTLPFISLVVVIVCTTAIILRLKVTASWRKSVSSMTSVEKQEDTVTRMLVTVCCVYVVCITPSVTRSLVLFSRLPGFLNTGHLCNAFKVTVALTHMLEAFNSSINFHIYIRQSSLYRSTLRQICPCAVMYQNSKGNSMT